MAPAKLDRSRSYAQIYPDGGYEQDHKLFDHNGNEVVTATEAPAAPPVDEAPRQPRHTPDAAPVPSGRPALSTQKLRAQVAQATGKAPAAGTTRGKMIATLDGLDGQQASRISEPTPSFDG